MFNSETFSYRALHLTLILLFLAILPCSAAAQVITTATERIRIVEITSGLESRYATRPAISSGVPTRPTGCWR